MYPDSGNSLIAFWHPASRWVRVTPYWTVSDTVSARKMPLEAARRWRPPTPHWLVRFFDDDEIGSEICYCRRGVDHAPDG